MESIKEFPRGISDRVISGASATARVQRAPDPSYKLQATSRKLQAASFKHLVELQAASVECGPNHQATGKAFRDDRSGDRGSRSSHKVLLVQKRLPGL